MGGSLGGLIAAFPTPVTGSFESIATISGTGSSGSITFSSIPSTYKSLQLRIIGQNTGGFPSGIPAIRFNGDTGANYSAHNLLGNGSAVSAGGAANRTYIDNAGTRIVPWSAVTNVMWVAVIDIIDYASTSKNKTARWFDGANSNGVSGYDRVELVSGNWRNTSAVNSITVLLTADSWTTTSQFALYGVK